MRLYGQPPKPVEQFHGRDEVPPFFVRHPMAIAVMMIVSSIVLGVCIGVALAK